MTEASLTLIRRLLVERYDELKRRLARRLGSAELAGEALQDAWLRMARVDSVGVVRDPGSYIFGVAMNAARDRQRNTDSRTLSAAEVDGLLEIADGAPDPEQVARARSDLRGLEAILHELPPRRRAILLAARLDQMPRQEIARRFGISLRLVELELQRAQEYCLSGVIGAADSMRFRRAGNVSLRVVAKAAASRRRWAWGGRRP
ncbi:sigma-70 family RNA polymerase sigma factor [Bradyrhizobium sp. 41S5]|uniref:RNA polymerase sigma factor n=1 Tax=Bradyrhizobium sp. 41S5 TaxID=1404443 RepID=UPI00156A88FD|nr:sigma-70 family RNA polymerase sigma factor [Bradyrhizobium sp. 41S5]UFX47591.1 sigma-70 family RNA polymerase sigma factor [Bradyrhizobium sp. 41S5]